MDPGGRTARCTSNEIATATSTVSRDLNHLPLDSNICRPRQSIAFWSPYL
jgi:hypothetical protein